MPTRLKRLELHGFKSFANPTTFVFDPGITAIIGPNGSGKSNIADALRWVLGEQSYANLRGRRTEDVIFAGSASRAPIGMAEVSVTLDNESGELPISFSEVTITRRAFRSGENQYLINGSKVRLKDIAQLTSSLGQAHTVIGQGLVDAVLSQRPEERRGLFEHAAGISGLRLKYAEAERHLAESRANSTRLEDLLAEIEPRLRSLARAAKQAREHDEVRSQLQEALRRSYAWHWREVQSRSTQSLADVQRAETLLRSLEDQRQSALHAVEQTEATIAATRQELEQLTRELDRLKGERQRTRHELALIQERRTGTGSRRADLAGRAEALHSSLAANERDASEIEQSSSKLAEDIRRQQQEIAELEQADSEARAYRAEVESRQREVAATVASLEREILSLRSRLTLLDGQETDTISRKERLGTEREERDQRIAEIQAQIDAAECARAAADERLTAILDQQERIKSQISEAEQAHRDATALTEKLERRSVELGTRLETLERLRESGAGLYTGVKAVLDGARAGRLDGIVGTLSSLLNVPVELEAAIEAALGGHLQDLVVERWADAERAIEHLKRTNSGRATFQPLDTVRRGGGSRPPAHNVRGVWGVASDLIAYDERIDPVVQGLLGRTMVADGLDATRALLPSLSPGWSAVTLAGEIARASGTVTGGARVRESGALARDRELRELPGLVQQARSELANARDQLDQHAAAGRALRQQLASHEQEASDAREEARSASAALDRAERWLADLRRAEGDEQTRAAEIEHLLTGIQNERQAITVRLTDRETVLDEARTLADDLQRQLDQHGLEQTTHLQEARVALSGLIERQRSLKGQQQRLRQQREALQRDITGNAERMSALDDETERFDTECARLERAGAEIEDQLDRIESHISPVRETYNREIAKGESARNGLAELENRLRDAERERDRLSLEHSRRQDEIGLLKERASHDLDDDEIEALLADTPIEEQIDLQALERDINRLRERLRRIGMVGDDAIEQYEREAERHAFLRQQLDDVHSASEALRAMLVELDRTMANEFDRTFGDVARAFESTFTTLFGGGKAKLIRNEEEGGSTGVEIAAQPPGKRLQNLALLSGGERALTAVALLFAILKVNPSPFCLLDEVDAALDEANVVRVREELRSLAERTQFVVVTHNRATIEGGDTLYGITMSDDGQSRVLSLKLPAEAVV